MDRPLPPSWTWTTLGNTCEVVLGQSPPSSTYNEKRTGLPFFQGKAEFTDLHPIVRKWCTEPKRIAEPNDILVSVRAPVGATNIADRKCGIGRGLAAMRYPHQNKVLFYYLRLVERKLDEKGTGTTFRAISGDVLRDFPFPLPPLPEQHRIVEKIEALFSELDKGIEQLKTTQAQLKVYRQSVLKWAFEGRLTEEWRKSVGATRRKMAAEPAGEFTVGTYNCTSLPNAHELLSRIRHEREEQARLRSLNFGGRAKARGRKLKPIPPLTQKELSELPNLPEGWAWVRMGEVSSGVEYGSAAKSRETGKVPVLRMGNIQNGRFDWTDLVYTSDKEEIKKYLLKPNDVLFNRTNSAELVGKTAIYNGERPAIFAGYLIRINMVETLIDSDYLTYFLNSHFARSYGDTVKTFGVNQSNINGTKLLGYPLPVTSISEQRQIVQEIETRLSVCDKLEETIAEALSQSEALRQSILKKAFEGKLVPQDPNDEPASVLLERIKAERINGEEAKKTNRLTRKRKTHADV